MKYESLTFITGNQGKVRSVKRLIKFPFDVLDVDLVEVQSVDLHEVVKQKAISAYQIIQKPVLVEDVSLVFDEWKSLPGTFIKWFEKELGNNGLIKIAHSLKSQNATATVLYGFYDGVELHFFEGVLKGKISRKEKGKRKFGWDPIFIPNGKKKTIAQMDDEELDEISPRKIALLKFEEFIS